MPKLNSKTVQVHLFRFDLQREKYDILILKRTNETPVYPDRWQVVTGKLEDGEHAFRAALREAKEETGTEPLKAWVLPLVASFYNYKSDEIDFPTVFAFLIDFDSEIILSDEHADFKWINFDEISRYVAFPSQIEGCRILSEFIINNENSDMYQIDLNFLTIVKK